jgi:phage baseplate assembly protein W
MPAPFLGSGLGFPIDVDGDGALLVIDQEDSVRQAVWIILATARGERRMRPDFGCGIHDLMFENATTTTAGRVAREVREALRRFEPRIDVDDVSVTAGEGDATLLIDVSYRVRATNAAFNLVYPFYLNGGAQP